jgi:hypothetical protein
MATFALDDLAIQRSHAVQSSSEVSRGVTPRLFQSFQPCHFTTGGVGCGELLLRLPVGLAKHVDVTSHPTQDVQVLMSLCDEAGMESAKGGDVALGCFNPALGMRAHDNQTACQSAEAPRQVSRQRACSDGIWRHEFELEHLGDPGQILHVPRHQNGANFPAGPRDQDVEHEALTKLGKYEALVLNETGQRGSQRRPCGRGWIQQTTAAHVWRQDETLERSPLARAACARS